jgi:hypothetical protein
VVSKNKKIVVSHGLVVIDDTYYYGNNVPHRAVIKLLPRRTIQQNYSRAHFYDVKGDRRRIMIARWESIHAHTINFEDWERYNAKP